MKLLGIDFGNVLGASGVQGFFGEGYWFHHVPFRKPDFTGMTFVSKTATLLSHKGDGVYNLEYVKGDSKKLFRVMYHNKNILYFSKKYNKLKTALKQDKKLGLPFLQKQRKSPE